MYYNDDKLTDDVLSAFTAKRKRIGESYQKYILFFQALRYIKDNKINKADSIIEKLSSDDEKTVKALTSMILGKISQKELFKIENRPWQKSVVWYFLGEYYLAKKDYPQAKSCFKKVKEFCLIAHSAAGAYFTFDCSIYADARLEQLNKINKQ